MPATPEFRNHWRRLRIAVTPTEWKQIEEYYDLDTNALIVAMAIRGVPVFIEQEPLSYNIPFKPKHIA